MLLLSACAALGRRCIRAIGIPFRPFASAYGMSGKEDAKEPEG